VSARSASTAQLIELVETPDEAAAAVDRRDRTVYPLSEGRRWPATVIVLAADAVVLSTAMLLAFRLERLLPAVGAPPAPRQHLLVAAASLPLWALLLSSHGLYATPGMASRLEEFREVARALVEGTMAMTVLGFAIGFDLGRGWVGLTFICGLVGLTVGREFSRRVLWAIWRRGLLLRPLIVVGEGAEAQALAAAVSSEWSVGYRLAGIVRGVHEGSGTPERRAAAIDRTVAAAVTTGVRDVVVVTSALEGATANLVVRRLTDAGVGVQLSSSLLDIEPRRFRIRPLGRYPVMCLEPARLSGWRAIAKRGLDVTVAGTALLVTLPLMIISALAIKLESRGPLLFRQERVGLGGRRFRVLKVRTMVANAEELLIDLRDANAADGPLFKVPDDPRVTRVGRVLRRFSVDELPQLWNVLRGEMSLVGPRPGLPAEMHHWGEDLHRRLRVKPGITGMWQVSGRSDSSFADYARWDLYYVDNWSFWTDLAILAKTIPVVLARRGAY